ncbi:MAG: hypothetical protein Q8Q67_01085 [bacterium]|nr:hypothetical protein [bacterium]
MHTKEKDFADYLNQYKDVASNLTGLIVITERIEKQKGFAEVELINCMKQEITSRCSTEFVAIMKQEVSEKLKSLNLFSGKKTNLDYLAEVIFRSLTNSPYIIGYQHFIAPGANYEASREFYDKFFKDFIMINELFDIELKEVTGVKVGYAIEFYLT